MACFPEFINLRDLSAREETVVLVDEVHIALENTQAVRVLGLARKVEAEIAQKLVEFGFARTILRRCILWQGRRGDDNREGKDDASGENHGDNRPSRMEK